MKLPVAVHLTGSDGMGWALDQDLGTVWQALSRLTDMVTLVSRRRASVIHSAWSYPLVIADPADFAGRRVICHMCNDVFRTLGVAAGSMHRAADVVGLWVAMTRRASAELAAIGWRSVYIPYTVDTGLFSRSPPSPRDELRRIYGIPPDSYVVLSVMRDSLGADLGKPKPQKAPESWVDILATLKRRGHPVHALLAGPRRHWIREALARHGVGYTQIGEVRAGDDVGVNILAPVAVNPLYHAADLCLITSRWEGGPRSVLEAAATGTRILSPAEGLAEDVLEPASVYRCLDEAVETIDDDIRRGVLAATVEPQYRRIVASFTPDKNVPRFRDLYRSIEDVPVFQPPRRMGAWLPQPIRSRSRDAQRRRLGRRQLLFGIPARVLENPDWGDFLLLLRAQLGRAGHTVAESPPRAPDAWIVDRPTLLAPAAALSAAPTIVCMDDAPATGMPARSGRATHVFHSGAVLCRWSRETAGGGMRPVVIPRVADPGVFRPPETPRVLAGGPIRIAVATAAPDEDRRLLERSLAAAGEGAAACEIEWLPVRTSCRGAGLRRVARQLEISHVLVSLDRDAPAPAWLPEAIAAGLPVIYPPGGGHGEIVRRGGLGYGSMDEIPGCIERVRRSYELLCHAVWFDSIETVAGLFVDLARDMRLA